MALRCAIIGLDPIQKDWIDALTALTASGEIVPIAAGHRTLAAARDLGDLFKVPAFDDLRQLLLQHTPQMIVLDRPSNADIEFLMMCAQQKVGIFSLGPPVHTVAEAHDLGSYLEPRTALLYIYPRLAGTPGYKHCAQADEFVKPIRLIVARFFALNHALAKTSQLQEDAIRSLTVLAWDALRTLIELLGLPETVYASVRGTSSSGGSFGDISGSAALTLRFPDDATANVTLSDHIGPWQRELLLLGQPGTLQLDERHYRFADAHGTLIDEGTTRPCVGVKRALVELREFIEHLEQLPSPHRGWEHLLEPVAATMEAMVVSHRTGQAESPERFLLLRR
jgi:predicted dehydrogenase